MGLQDPAQRYGVQELCIVFGFPGLTVTSVTYFVSSYFAFIALS